MRSLTLDLLPDIYGVARLTASEDPPPARIGALRILIDDPRERTLICPMGDLDPQGAKTQWRALLICDNTTFDEPGILVSITRPIAEAGIGLLGHSTFTADSVMVASADLDAAITALQQAGHTVRRP